MDNEDLDLIPEVDVGIGHLEKLDTLWNLQSKVIVDIKELKGEKRSLRCENEKLKRMLRLVLEEAALRQGNCGESSNSVDTSSRSCFSATLPEFY